MSYCRSRTFCSTILPAALVVCLLVGAPTLAAGARTRRVSVSSAEVQGNGTSFRPSTSADGRYVAFASQASDLVADDTNGTFDVFVGDRQAGTTQRLSVGSGGVQGNGGSTVPSISSDGRYVAFVSDAGNLVADDTNGVRDVFVRDRQTSTTTRVSVSSAGLQGTRPSVMPSISSDGRFIAFASDASGLVADDTNSWRDVFVRDQRADTTTLVSISSAELQANGYSESPSISADGRYVAFTSSASDLIAGDTNHDADIFVRDRQAGTTERVSIDSHGLESSHSDGAVAPSISADGRYVVFVSGASDLVRNDTNGVHDVFVRDRQAGTTRRASITSAELQANGPSFMADISADGRYVVFVSGASDLVAHDTNGARDIFLRDRQVGTTIRIGISSGGLQADQGSYMPSISADGRYVAFTSLASDLVANDTNRAQDVFVRGPLH